MLNDAKIKAAKPKDKPYKLGDSGQLYLMGSPTSSRLWRMNYSFRPSLAAPAKQKTLSLGAYPTITLADARKRRDEAKELIRQGIDPAVKRKVDVLATAEAHSNTFEIVARAWWGKQRPRWSKVHAQDVIKSLDENVFPHIGALPISTIKAPKLLEILTLVENRGAIETAHRIRSRISSVFVYAIAAGLAEADPASSLGKALEPKPRAKRQPAITSLKEVQQMLLDCEAERCRASTKLAMRFAALTAVRPGELRGARWDEFEDLETEEPLWRIPATRMKGTEGRKLEDLRRLRDHVGPDKRYAL